MGSTVYLDVPKNIPERWLPSSVFGAGGTMGTQYSLNPAYKLPSTPAELRDYKKQQAAAAGTSLENVIASQALIDAAYRPPPNPGGSIQYGPGGSTGALTAVKRGNLAEEEARRKAYASEMQQRQVNMLQQMMSYGQALQQAEESRKQAKARMPQLPDASVQGQIGQTSSNNLYGGMTGSNDYAKYMYDQLYKQRASQRQQMMSQLPGLPSLPSLMMF